MCWPYTWQEPWRARLVRVLRELPHKTWDWIKRHPAKPAILLLVLGFIILAVVEGVHGAFTPVLTKLLTAVQSLGPWVGWIRSTWPLTPRRVRW